MNFWRRFRTYLVGVGLGLLLTYVFFGDRDFHSWTPEGRVLLAIDSSEVSFSDKAKCQLLCLDISKDSLLKIQDDAMVDFSESETHKDPCPVYTIKHVINNGMLKLEWEVCENEEKVELISISSTAHSCGNC